MLSLSYFIAQGLPKSYIGLTGLQIEIWPPHHDLYRRNIEMLYLHEHLRKLRDKLRAGPQIPQLSIRFRENWIVKWSEESQPREALIDYDRYTRDDMQIVLDLFAYITNVNKVKILLPPTLRWHQSLREYASLVIWRMEKGFLKHDLAIYNKQDKSILDNPFSVDTKQLEKTFLNHIKTDDDDPFAIDFQLMYLAWYGDADQLHKKRRLVSDFENMNLYDALLRSTIDASERIEAVGL